MIVLNLVVDYMPVIIPVSMPCSPHGDVYIEEDSPSEMYKEGVDIVNGE